MVLVNLQEAGARREQRHAINRAGLGTDSF